LGSLRLEMSGSVSKVAWCMESRGHTRTAQPPRSCTRCGEVTMPSRSQLWAGRQCIASDQAVHWQCTGSV
jgi:hypothetical protein